MQIINGDSLEVLKSLSAETIDVVAKQQGKNFIGIELNPNYCKLAEERIKLGV